MNSDVKKYAFLPLVYTFMQLNYIQVYKHKHNRGYCRSLITTDITTGDGLRQGASCNAI